MQPQPFFSIGVTTYNRHYLLKQTLDSILAQKFANFEVIVGNDFTDELLTGELIGISDTRIRFVNHHRNLREIGNMNALLSLAQGRYFTWLFDDDLFEPDFLQIGHDSLAAADFPDAFFSSYRLITSDTPPPPFRFQRKETIQFSGAEFLLRYSASRPDVISTCGLINTSSLRDTIGGIRELSDSAIGLYSEYLLLVGYGLLERIVFMDVPLVIFRAHSGSWGESNTEMEIYPAIGAQLIRMCWQALRHPELESCAHLILLEICKTHLLTYYKRIVQYELANNNSKISRAVKYRYRYYREVYRIWKMYAELTGGKATDCAALFFNMFTDVKIFPPVWDSAALDSNEERCHKCTKP